MNIAEKILIFKIFQLKKVYIYQKLKAFVEKCCFLTEESSGGKIIFR